jgi:hypothetical protein
LFSSVGSPVQIQRSSFLDNSAIGGNDYWDPAGAGEGGAVYASDAIGVFDSRFSGNAAIGGSNDWTYLPGAGRGGAIYATAMTVITGSTFDNNETRGGANGRTEGSPSQGGSIWISGTLTASNSTWTLNEAFGTGTASGGAVFLSGAAATLVNVTIAQNRADGGASLGGGLGTTNSTATVFGSIIANNSNGGDVWGNLIDAGYNLCSDGTAHFSAIGSLNNTDPVLGALADNGGPTPTLPLLVGSPARDAIPSGFPATDQRGVARPQGPEADMGAFEADYVAGPPVIANQPQGGTVRAGTNFTFTVVAVGNGSLAYQWRKNGNPIPGATTSTLSLANVQAPDAATYSVVVSDSSGTTPSQGAVLVVDSTPRILAQPTSVVVAPGATTNFTVTADGPALNFQWWHEGAAISGATNPTLNIGSALAGAQGGYWAVITNFTGSVTSQVVTLTFDAAALSILVPPQDQTVESGYPATFTVLVSGVPPFTYQWQHNGTVLSGATTSALVLASAQTNDAGSYTVVVSNGYAVVRSAAAQLTITPGAVAPLLVVGRLGDTLTITFTAEGGRTYRLLSTSDSAGWTSIATNAPLAPGLVQFTEPISNVGRFFYRVATP